MTDTVAMEAKTIFGEFAALDLWVHRLRQRRCPRIRKVGESPLAGNAVAIAHGGFDGEWSLPLTDEENHWLTAFGGLDRMIAKPANACLDLDGDRVALWAQEWIGQALPPFAKRQVMMRLDFIPAKVTVVTDSWGYLTVTGRARTGLLIPVVQAIQPGEAGGTGIPLWAAIYNLVVGVLEEIERERTENVSALADMNRAQRRAQR